MFTINTIKHLRCQLQVGKIISEMINFQIIQKASLLFKNLVKTLLDSKIKYMMRLNPSEILKMHIVQ